MTDDAKTSTDGLTSYPRATTARERELEARLAQSPDNIELKKALAFTLYTNQKFERSVALYVEVAAADPSDPNAYFYQGNGLYRLGQLTRAIELWEKAIEVDTVGVYSERAGERVAMAKGQMFKERDTKA